MNRRKKWRTAVWIAALALVALTVAAPAQVANNHKAEMLLQEAHHSALMDGDLERSIELCKKILADHSNNRAVVAKALVQMGQCYEKLGRAEARKAYERVVNEFTDQAEPVRVARQQLEQLDTGTQGAAGNGPTYRLLVDAETLGTSMFGVISPSGKYISFVKDDKLYVSDQTGTAIRVLLEDWGTWESPMSVRWSPDERLVAYRVSRDVKTDSGTKREHAIFVVDADDGTPRQVGPEIRGHHFIYGPRWMPDGRHLAYRTDGADGGLHTITLDGDEVRVVPNKAMAVSREGKGLLFIGHYSPNGRWYVYSCLREKPTHRRDMDLWVISSSGGKARRLTHLPEFNGLASWAPDGRTLYFVSGPVGRYNIWRLAMDPATGLAKGEPQQMTFFEDVFVLWPTPHGDGSRISFRMFRDSTSIRVADVSAPHAARTLVRSGKYSPILSPDGQTVYYVNDLPGQEGIYAMSRHGGVSQRLTRSLPAEGWHSHLTRFDLSPDGRTLTYITKTEEQYGLFTQPVSGGEPILLAKMTQSINCGVPQWSPDGSLLAYADGNDLYVISAKGGEPQKLAHARCAWMDTIRWSPNGKYIAAFGCSGSDKTNNAVVVVPASGGKLRQLTPYGLYKEGLEWHPDNTRLTYQTYANPSQTHQAYLDGRAPDPLLDAPDIWDYVGTWHPDGRRYFFLGDVEGQPNWNIYTYDEASGKTSLAVANLPNAGVPCWSRDGQTMAWWATKRTPFQLWMMENFLPESKTSE